MKEEITPMKLLEIEYLKAINCLFIQCPESVAQDVKNKVFEFVKAKETVIEGLSQTIDSQHQTNAAILNQLHSLQDRLANTFTKQEVIDLIIKERKRAVDIAHSFWKSNDKIYQDKKSAGQELAFISDEIANECRLVGNAISGLNALSITLGETIESTITQELSDLPPHRNSN